MLPRISIVTPSYNQGAFLEETICSVLDQGYANLEYIIIDGGSTDNSPQIIEKYAKHLAFWASEPDTGQSQAINKGFARADGEVLGWLNSDDILLPGALETVGTEFAAPDRGWDVLVGWGYIIDALGNRLQDRRSDRLSREEMACWGENYFLQQACFWSSECWRVAGPLAEFLHCAMDLDLWLRFAAAGFTFRYIDRPLGCWRKHAGAKTDKPTPRMLAETCIVRARNGFEPLAVEQAISWLEQRDRLAHHLDRLLKFPGLRPLLRRLGCKV